MMLSSSMVSTPDDADMSAASDSDAEEDAESMHAEDVDAEPPANSLCECGGSCKGRPSMAPRSPGARVFSCRSTPCSRALAARVHEMAASTTKTHGYSTTGTPWLFARRVRGTKLANETFLTWCREWISELFGVDSASLHAARTEPHMCETRVPDGPRPERHR